MRKLSRYLILIFLALIIFDIPATAESNSIKVFVNGKALDDDVVLVVENGRTLIPIKFISEELGFDAKYIEESGRVNIKKDDRNIEITIDSDKAKVNNKEVELDVKPFTKENMIFVPLRFISESLGEEVIWDEKNKIALVGKFPGEAKVENTFLYFNNEHSYTLNLPNSWKEETIIKTEDGTLYVYDKKTAKKFIEDGHESFGPVFEIRWSDYPIIATLPYEGDYILSYKDGMYSEALFCRDFQFYPETKDSYMKIFNEAQDVLGSFKVVDEGAFVEDDNKNYMNEIDLLHDILDNYVPGNIFNRDEIYTHKSPISNTSFLYMRNIRNEEEVLIKIEDKFDKNSKLIRYHLKNYWHNLVKNKLSQSEALELANSFINKYVDEVSEVVKKPDLYPSLYEKEKHETYGDKDGKYIIVVDLEHGFIEYFSKN
ncbi:copper amine oxidase N-terminal domain-containing protein [Tissierella praeacuta]|uniref:copper amine oxidase N-terminal domain-containing protein n=1 Tax=Tissierella praeacuta TaxID=43131 RepID=UPI00333F2679